MKTIIELAREAGFWQEHTNTWMCSGADIERFAQLVREDYRAELLAGSGESIGKVKTVANLTDEETTELLDWVSACQSAYALEQNPRGPFRPLPGQLRDNRQGVVDHVNEILSSRTHAPDDTALLRQALEALTNCNSEHGHRCNRCDSEVDPNGELVATLRERLGETK